MSSRNTTNQNKSKRTRLASQHVMPKQNITSPDTPAFLRSLLDMDADVPAVIGALIHVLIGETSNPACRDFLETCPGTDLELPEPVPSGEFDLLGTAYQFLSTKRDNLARGTFYTGEETARLFVSDLDFSANQQILDPACGSGAFLLAASAAPEQLHGLDADPVAIMIATANYYLKFPDADAPDFRCIDFFSWLRDGERQYDYVIGNPPYGADIDPALVPPGSAIRTGESFSLFAESCVNLVKPDGTMRFLLPEAFLNVAQHADIRRFLLGHAHLRRIRLLSQRFGGVMSDTYLVEVSPLGTGHEDESHRTFANAAGDDNHNDVVRFVMGSEVADVPVSVYRSLPDCRFTFLTETDRRILTKVQSRSDGLRLPADAFALGIVTGGNRRFLTPDPTAGSEPIMTGKEIVPGRYAFLPARSHIVFDRTQLQQVAPTEAYRAVPKLVYKVICKRLRFVMDRDSLLTTNSANIVLPGSVADMDPYVLLALLNSDVFSFYAAKQFGGVNKVSKAMLMSLPLPQLTAEQAAELSSLARECVDAALADPSVVPDDSRIQHIVNTEVYDLSGDEVARIKRRLTHK